MLDESNQVEFSLRHKNTKTVHANINKSALIQCCHVRFCSLVVSFVMLCSLSFYCFMAWQSMRSVWSEAFLSSVCHVSRFAARWCDNDFMVILKDL